MIQLYSLIRNFEVHQLAGNRQCLNKKKMRP